MPIFDFHCAKCGHAFEELVRGDQAPACPKCAAVGAERQFPLSVAVSTPKSRARTAGIARRAAKAVHRDKQVADSEARRKTLEQQLDVKLGEAEKTIAATKATAMGNVRSIATDAAAAIDQRLTGTAPSADAVSNAVGDVLKR